MQISYFPGRLRVRDPIFRNDEIRSAAESVVRIICSRAEITYTEKTSGILAVYPPESVDIERLKEFVPYLLKIEPKVRFYTPKKKQAVLAGIEEIRRKAEEMFTEKE